jgi:hypothetical protein
MTQLIENKQSGSFLINYFSGFFARRNPADRCTLPRSTNKYSSLPSTPYAVLVPTLRAAVKWSAIQRAAQTE